jgi:catechol 2,3-dioxygenase-like lactoylglutathione lyase family enzyme
LFSFYNQSMSFEASGINHVTLLVQDKQASEKFYTQSLGLKPHYVGKSLWIHAGDKQFLHLTQMGENPFQTFQHVGVMIANWPEFLHYLEEHKVVIHIFDSQRNLIQADCAAGEKAQDIFLYDLDGNLLEFIDEKNMFFQPEVEN